MPKPQTLIIHKFNNLFNILNEIKNILNFEVVCDNNDKISLIEENKNILVISGKSSQLTDGTSVGYSKVMGGGRAFRIPVLHQIESMPLTTIPIDIQVKNAYSKGGIPLDVHAVANIKISSEDRHVGNAIERFLGRDPVEIQRVGKESLEGHPKGCHGERAVRR